MRLRIPTFWTSMALTSIVFTLSVLLTISWYGSKTTLPSSVTVEDWSVGGMPIQEFERQLAWKKELLLGQKVRLVATVSGGQPLIVERTLGLTRTRRK